MNDPDKERNAKNQEIVAALRELFAPLTHRLTPDVEPAMVYQPITTEPEDEE